MSSVTLSQARYGKQAIRVFRIVREGNFHTVAEYNVTSLLEGDIDIAYTEADNSVIVATDSIKNITYHLAKTSPHILHPERFALHLGTYFVSKYAHIHKAFITIEQLRWQRIDVNGQKHNHSFYRDGDEKRLVDVTVDASKGKDSIVATVAAGLSDLLVLKSSGSSFEKFIRDEHTTLVEVNDRIFSTSVDLKYTYASFSVPKNTSLDSFALPPELSGEGTSWDGNNVVAKARTATLEVFAEDESASVQATLYKMAERIIAENKHIQTVFYSLPNKHYIPVDMRYAGLDNLTPCVSYPVTFPQTLAFYLSHAPPHWQLGSAVRVSTALLLSYSLCHLFSVDKSPRVHRVGFICVVLLPFDTTSFRLFLSCSDALLDCYSFTSGFDGVAGGCSESEPMRQTRYILLCQTGHIRHVHSRLCPFLHHSAFRNAARVHHVLRSGRCALISLNSQLRLTCMTAADAVVAPSPTWSALHWCCDIYHLTFPWLSLAVPCANAIGHPARPRRRGSPPIC